MASSPGAARRRLLLDGIDLTPEISAADEGCDLDEWGWSYGVRPSGRLVTTSISSMRGHWR